MVVIIIIIITISIIIIIIVIIVILFVVIIYLYVVETAVDLLLSAIIVIADVAVKLFTQISPSSPLKTILIWQLARS